MEFGTFLNLMLTYYVLSTSAQNRTIQAIYISIHLDLLTAFYIFFLCFQLHISGIQGMEELQRAKTF